MSNSSSAYNLSNFAPLPQKAPQKAPLRVVRSRPRAFADAFAPRVLCAFAIVITLASLIVYNQVYLNELTREVNALNSQLAILESEHVRYTSLLESTVSLRAVAQQVEYMGMVRLDQARTVYVYLYEEDQIISFRALPPEYEQRGIMAALGSFFDRREEYISGP